MSTAQNTGAETAPTLEAPAGLNLLGDADGGSCCGGTSCCSTN